MSVGTIERHSGDYKADAWKAYSDEELRWWVHLLRKRAEMRTDGPKKDKDLYDADNYEAMLKARESAVLAS